MQIDKKTADEANKAESQPSKVGSGDETQPVFKGPTEAIDRVDLEVPIKDVPSRYCEHYVSAFNTAAKEAADRGEEPAAAVYSFLGVLVSFYPDFGDKLHPYRPMWQMEGRRSLIPEDLQPDDLLALRAIAERVHDPALRARIHDVLWCRETNHLDCAESAKSFRESAEQLDTEEDWHAAVTQYHRGLQLAERLGRHKEGFQEIAESLIAAIERDPENETTNRTSQLMHVALDFGCGDHEALATIAHGIGTRASQESENRRARGYWELEAEFLKAAKDEEASREAMRRVGESLVADAQARASGENGSHLAAVSFLKEAIEILRRSRGTKERIEELRSLLAEYQKKSLSEMKVFEYGMDITKMVEEARNHVAKDNLFDAMKKFAFGYPLTDVATLRQEVLDAVNQFPITHLFAGSQVDGAGRSTVERKGLLGLEGEDAENEIEAEMFTHFARYNVGIRTQGFIEPARQQILNDHHPTLRNLAPLVRHNPFVPPGHEGVYLRGIHAGFHGDFLVASHLLIPQIEESIRYILEGNGVDVSNLKSDRTQPLKVLGPLFGMKETKEIFGESLCFELRGLLIEKTAFGFRDRLCHGFVTEGDCYDVAPINLWWLVVRLCLTSVVRQARPCEAPDTPSSSHNEQNSDKEK